ncbi:carbohydrate ABC transporter permease [Nonomuraea rhodomycinica]|nr:carbohydrate ABC transporter permease [Nonomuraea rhodomycinica]
MSRPAARRGRGLLLELVMAGCAVAFVFPLYVLLMVALKRPQDVAADVLAPPFPVYWGNLAEAWSSAEMGKALVNSTVVTSLSVMMLVLTGSLASFALARWKRGLGYGVFLLFVLGLVIPLQLGMIPLYQLMRDAGLLKTYTSLIVFYTGHELPLTVFLYCGFLRALPRAYEEAAYVDGATAFQAFRRVVFPMLRPVTGTVIILNALFIWNDFLTPMLYVSGTAQQTVPVAVFSFVGEYSSDWGIIFAGLAIAVAPILVLYFVFQRHIIKGFAGGLKG